MQVVTGEFEELSRKDVRKPIVGLNVAWTRTKDESIDFGVVGTSLVGSGDIVQGELGVITNADLFEYFDESERVISVSTDKERVEPLGGVSYSRATGTLDNKDNRFTPLVNPTIGFDINRNRPVKMFLGFENTDNSLLKIPTIYGITKDIEENQKSGTIKLQMFDYISIVDNFELSNQVFVNKRTDEIIESILIEMGFVEEQFDLNVGQNTIGFAWIQKGAKAGEIIRKLVQSEGGEFFQNELGDILFRTYKNIDFTDLVEISTEDVIAEENNYSSNTYNRIEIKAKPRIVLDEEVVYESSNSIEVATGVSSFFITLDNPLYTLSSPASGTNWVANSARDGSGSNVTAGVAVTYTNFVDTVKVNVNNTSGNVAYLTTLTIEGEPAVVEKIIEEVVEDATSQEEYGVLLLTIENDFITDSAWARTYAEDLLERFSPTRKELSLTIPARPQIMIGDRLNYLKTNSVWNFANPFYGFFGVFGALEEAYLNYRYLFYEYFYDLSDDWNGYGGGVSVSDSALRIALIGASPSYSGIVSAENYDLTGKMVELEVADEGNQAWASIEVYLSLVLDGNNSLTMLIANGVMYARKKVAGSTTTLASVAYDLDDTYMPSIREEGGTTYWEYIDVDGEVAVLHSEANPISVTSLGVEVGAGNWGVEAGTTEVSFGGIDLATNGVVEQFHELPLIEEDIVFPVRSLLSEETGKFGIETAPFSFENKELIINFGDVSNMENGDWTLKLGSDLYYSYIYIDGGGLSVKLSDTPYYYDITEIEGKYFKFIENSGLSELLVSQNGKDYELLERCITPSWFGGGDILLKMFTDYDTTPGSTNDGNVNIKSVVLNNIVYNNGIMIDSVLFDNSSVAEQVISDSITLSHTVGIFQDRLLIVGTTVRGAVTVTAMTYGGEAMTKLTHQQLGSDGRTEMWYMVNPPIGTADIVATFSASQNVSMIASSYFNVDSLYNEDGESESDVSTTSLTMSNENGEAIISVIGSQGYSVFQGGESQIQRGEVSETNVSQLFSDILVAEANAVVEYGISVDKDITHCAVVLKPKSQPLSNKAFITIKRIQTTFDANSGLIQKIIAR